MKFCTLASLCVAATLGRTGQAATTFDNLLFLVAQIQDEATMLSTECAAKDDEVASLIAQLSACEGPSTGADGTESSSSKPEPAPEPAAPTPAPVAPTPEPTSLTPGPSPKQTTTRTSPEPAPEPTAPAPTPSVSGGDFKLSIGQSWNYNLDMPWNIDDVDVDVYFIDMSE